MTRSQRHLEEIYGYSSEDISPSEGNASIGLFPRHVAEDAALGALIGTLVVAGATGTPTYSLVDSAGNRFAIDGDALERGATALDFEANTTHSITVSVSGMTPSPPDRVFMITVTDVFEGGGDAAMDYSLDTNSMYVALLADL